MTAKDEPADVELAGRYLRDDLPEVEREAFELRLLQERELFEDVRALELAAAALAAPGASRPSAHVRGRGPAAWLGWVAAFLLALPAGAWLNGYLRGGAGTVTRSASGEAALVPVDAGLDLDAGAVRLARARVLLSFAAPELGTGDVLRADWLGPRGERPAEQIVLRPTAGRVSLVVDARELSAGSWRLELAWSDAAGRPRGTRTYDLRVE